MTASLPTEVRQTFARFITTEYTTVDRAGQPITWPVTPYYSEGGESIDVTTGLGYPKKADDAEQNPRVSLLFSDPTGSGLERPCSVLVQGTAEVDYRDLRANRDRYARESTAKLPATKEMMPPKFLQSAFDWYLTRIYVLVRPERVYLWSGGDFGVEPQLFDSRMEEVRSAHSAEPAIEPVPPSGSPPVWDERLEELGRRHETAVLSYRAPDGFPFSVRVPIEPDRAAGRIRIGALPEAAAASPGRACLCAHAHDPEFRWQINFQVRGDLLQENGAWHLVPHRLIGGFELPPGGTLQRYRANARKIWRFRKIAKRELGKRRA